MNDMDRHGEVMGAIGGLTQKIDSHIKSNDRILNRHEAAIEAVTEDVDGLKVFRAKAKGMALAVTAGAALLAATTAIIARARGLF